MFGTALPPGQPILIDGTAGSRGAFDDSLCPEIEADGGFNVAIDRGDDRESITICSRSLTESGEEQIELFLGSIRWLDDTADPTADAAPTPAAPDAADMIGEWRLVSGIVHGDEVPVLERSPTTMSFSGQEMGGSTPCNRYGAEVQVDGDRLSVGMIVQTGRGCSGVVRDAEVLYFAALREVSEFGFDGDQLVLSGPDAVLLFSRLV
jgi:heat shock protein HslJ